MGPKRGRLLIRQPRIKRDSDSTPGGGSNQSPDTDYDQPSMGSFSSQRLLTVPHAAHQLHHTSSAPATVGSSLNPLLQSHHHHHHLNHPFHRHPHGKMERHASEPSPSNMSPTGGGSSNSTAGGGGTISGSTITSATHLLSVPSSSGGGGGNNSSGTPYLVKQHSHPLLLTGHSSFDSSSSHHPHHHSHHPHHYLHRQLSFPSESLLVPLSTTTASSSSSSMALSSVTTITTAASPSPDVVMRAISPTIVVVPDLSSSSSSSVLTSVQPTPSSAPPPSSQPPPLIPSVSAETFPSIRIKGEELQRSMSTPQPIRELSLENRSQHCPVIRPGPALGCNYCWNTIDGHGRILRRKTKYHCPECQTNLCIVPCFQEYHERQNVEQAASNLSSSGGGGDNNTNTATSTNSKTTSSSLRQYPKTGLSM